MREIDPDSKMESGQRRNRQLLPSLHSTLAAELSNRFVVQE